MSNHPIFIKDNGEAFTSAELEALASQLDGLDADGRTAARNVNADAIATHPAARLLVVSGPGTGKSTLFKGRIKYWLDADPECRIAVATFVRKLVRDLREDIHTDPDIGDEERQRVDVSTLHRMARSIVEQNHGSAALPLRPRCRIAAGQRWEEMIWADALCIEGESGDKYPWYPMLDSLYDGEPLAQAGWIEIRKAHLRLQQFYNALTFPDLILQATQAVDENSDLTEGTLYIIDEFQDFNLAEAAFIRAIASGSPGLLLAGDDDQVLYDTLRRGHASIIRDYYRGDPEFVNAMLAYCSRCSCHVVGAAAAFLAGDAPPGTIEKIFRPLRDEEPPPVTVIAATSPKVGVSWIEGFLKEHAKQIDERQAALDARAEKDPYLLVLTPDRSLKFLTSAPAEQLHRLLSQYASGAAGPRDDYWRVRDYYFVGLDPAQNYGVRKLMEYERLDAEEICRLVRRALDESKSFSALGEKAVTRCIDRGRQVQEILDSDATAAAKATQLASVITITDADALGQDLESHPITKRTEPDDDGAAQFEQSASVSAVEVTSIVGAKGLSADHVIVLGCDDSNLSRTSRNAFFVALTRARQSLTLLACIGGGGAKILHDFVRHLPKAHTQAVYAKAGELIIDADIAALQKRLKNWAYARSEQMKKRSSKKN